VSIFTRGDGGPKNINIGITVISKMEQDTVDNIFCNADSTGQFLQQRWQPSAKEQKVIDTLILASDQQQNNKILVMPVKHNTAFSYKVTL